MPKHTLSTPVILPNGQQYAVIEFPEPTLGGLAAHEIALGETGSSLAALIALLMTETGWPHEAVRRIRASDLEAVSGLVTPFLPRATSGESGEPSPPTSPTS